VAIARTGWNQIYTTSDEDPASGSLALGTNDGRAVVAFMSVPTAYAVSGVAITGGGTALTQVDTVDVDGFKRYLFAGLVTETGSQTVTFDTTAPAGQLKWGSVASYDGVDSVRSGGDVTSGASGTNPSITLTGLSANDMVVMLGITAGAGVSLTAAGAATDFDGGATDAIALQELSSGSSVTIDGTFSSVSAWYAGAVALAEISGPDTTAPTLSSPSGAATGKDAGSGTVTTNENNGTLYSVVTLTSTPPSAAQVKAGENASGTLLASGLRPTLAITTTGAKTVAYTGLTSGTAYFPFFMHEDTATNQSTVAAGASFTPTTMAYSGTIGAQTGTQGGAFVWSGANPSTLFSGGVGTRSFSGTGLSGSGLTVNSSTGVLSGTCGTAGTYTITIVGTDQSTAGTEAPQTESSNSFTLTISASGDTTRPTLGGVVTASSVTSSSAVLTWSAGSDNSGTIAGYDYQVNGGSFVSLGNVLTTTLTGLTASTAYTVNVRARDPSGNVSTPVITGGFTTGSGAAGTFTSAALTRNNGISVGAVSLTWLTFLNPTTGAFVVTKTGLSTNSSGVFSTTDAALTTGSYHAVWLEAGGQRGWGVASVS
jgi:hypothetical protein